MAETKKGKVKGRCERKIVKSVKEKNVWVKNADWNYLI